MDKRTPIDMQEFLNDISVPDLSGPLDLFSKDATHEQKDIFAIEKRKAWDKSVEARCDFTRRVRLTRRADTFFISLWQKSLYGRTLTDIKGDDSMVAFFADSISPLIRDILGEELNTGAWCIVTTPKRRHLVKNFATRISEMIASQLNIPFYEDVAFCHSKQRIGAVFTMNNLTDKLQQWLDTPSAERDWNEGAILLLQLTNNTIMYRNLSINPKGKAEFIEGKLRAFLKARREVEAHDEVNIMQEQVDAIVASRTEFSNKDTNPATDFKAGKRADHDSLPEDIQALYVENLDITHRMRELHLRLRLLSDSTKQVPAAERKPLLDEFINLDKKLHANWDTYDHYVTKAESAANTETNESEEEQTKETEIGQSPTDQLAEQPEDATPSKPKSKSKSKK